MKHKVSRTKVFTIIGSMLLLIYILCILITRGQIVYPYMFSNILDSFMDFFNSMDETIYRDPYSRGVIYPPLCYIIYYLFLRMIPHSQVVDIFRERKFSPTGMKLFQIPIVLYVLLLLIAVFITIFLLNKALGKKIKEKYHLIFLLCFSIPFIFVYERGNIVLISLIFSMIFFIFKDSSNKLLKECSLISLAISAGIKIYPAIYGLLLLKEKRYKDSIRTMSYGILFTFVPFLFFSGKIYNIISLLRNIKNTTTDFSGNRIAYLINFSAVLKVLLSFFSNNKILIYYTISFVISFLIIGGIISFFVIKNRTKNILILTCFIVGIPGFSYLYVSIFMIIPFILYILDESFRKKKEDWAYLFLFIFIFFPIPLDMLFLKESLYYYENMSLGTLQIGLSILLLALLPIFEAIIYVIKEFKQGLSIKLKLAFILSFFSIFIFFYKTISTFEKSIIIRNEMFLKKQNDKFVLNSGIDIYIEDNMKILTVNKINSIMIKDVELYKYEDVIYNLKNSENNCMIEKKYLDKLISHDISAFKYILNTKLLFEKEDDNYIYFKNMKGSHIYSRKNILIFYDKGFNNNFGTYRSTLKIFNPYSSNYKYSIEASIFISDVNKNLKIFWNDLCETNYLLISNSTKIEKTISLKEGLNYIKFDTNANDLRDFSERYSKKFILENIEIKSNSIFNYLGKNKLDLNDILFFIDNNVSLPIDLTKLNSVKYDLDYATQNSKSIIISYNIFRKILEKDFTKFSNLLKSNYVCKAKSEELIYLEYKEKPFFDLNNIILFNDFEFFLLKKENELNNIKIFCPYEKFEFQYTLDFYSQKIGSSIKIKYKESEKKFVFNNNHLTINNSIEVNNEIVELDLIISDKNEVKLNQALLLNVSNSIEEFIANDIEKNFELIIDNNDFYKLFENKNFVISLDIFFDFLLKDKKYIDLIKENYFLYSISGKYASFEADINSKKLLDYYNLGKLPIYYSNFLGKEKKYYGEKFDILIFNYYNVELVVNGFLEVSKTNSFEIDLKIKQEDSERNYLVNEYNNIIKEKFILKPGINKIEIYRNDNNIEKLTRDNLSYEIKPLFLMEDKLETFMRNNGIITERNIFFVEKDLRESSNFFYEQSIYEIEKWGNIFDYEDVIKFIRDQKKDFIMSINKFRDLSENKNFMNLIKDNYIYNFNNDDLVSYKYVQLLTEEQKNKFFIHFWDGVRTNIDGERLYKYQSIRFFVFNPHIGDEVVNVSFNLKNETLLNDKTRFLLKGNGIIKSFYIENGNFIEINNLKLNKGLNEFEISFDNIDDTFIIKNMKIYK